MPTSQLLLIGHELPIIGTFLHPQSNPDTTCAGILKSSSAMTNSISLIGRMATPAEFFIGLATICQGECHSSVEQMTVSD